MLTGLKVVQGVIIIAGNLDVLNLKYLLFLN